MHEDSGASSKRRRIVKVAVSTLVGSFPSIILQLAAIIALTTTEYGLFAIVYLVFGWFSSLSMSIVCEPWIRGHARGRAVDDWGEFGSISVSISLVGGLLASLAGTFSAGFVTGVASGLAVGTAVFRLNARYYGFAKGRVRANVVADGLGALIILLGLLVLGVDLFSLLISWAVSNLMQAALTPVRWRQLSWPGIWARRYRSDIGTLVIDSTLMDVSTIGVPLALAPAMGAANFGLYRAVGNIAFPVRLILGTARPFVAGLSPKSATKPLVALPLLVVGLVIAGALCGSVILVNEFHLVQEGVLRDLGEILVPVGLFVAMNFFGTFYQFIVRAHLGRRQILRLRVIQLIISASGPILGWLLGGVVTAVWGMALAMLLQAIVIFSFIAVSGRKEAA